MFDRIAVTAVARRRLILLATLMFCILAAGFGGKVSSRLSAGGYDVPSSESTAAATVLANTFHTGELNLVLLVHTPAGPNDPATARRGLTLTAALAREPGVQQVVSYWSLGDEASLRGAAGDSALVMAHINGNDDQVATSLNALRPHYRNGFDGLSLEFGGRAEAYKELTDQTQKDLELAETLILPLILLALIFVFRGVIAALLPLALGIIAIMGTLAVLRVLVSFTSVSVFAMNLTTALGLGLGIDYSLFVVSRYREELHRGAGVEQAIATSLRTAGRTVLFSSLTVLLSLSALLIFPVYFLRSFAYAGIPVVAFAALAALVVLPALLAMLGHRIDKWSVHKRDASSVEQGFWHRLATLVMRRPIPMGLAAVAILLLLGAPFLGIKYSLADERGLPVTAQAHQVHDILAADYSAREFEPMLVVAQGIGDPAHDQAAITAYAQRLSLLANVARVDALTGSFTHGEQSAPETAQSQRFAAADATYLSIVPSVDAYSDAGQQLVTAVRTAPHPFPILVGGEAAAGKDTLAALGDRLPYALLIIAVSTFILMFLLTGSVVMPLKALVLNTLSLSASFGAMVWVFQDGHLRTYLGHFTATGTIVATNPIMMFCVAFGLSMDYEVFLLSRIKEEYDTCGDNVRAVARGLERTGALVTAAAALLALVFVSFLTSGVSYMKMLGFGLALAVLADATLVRGVLVPAFMRLAGPLNWWAPAPLARLHHRLGLREDDPAQDPTTAPQDADAVSTTLPI
jgi:putative drug exporter of the RND superfamily